MSIHKLVFIHSGVKDAPVFYNTLPGVKALIVKNDDTAHSLLLKMTDISELTHVSIVFVNDNNKAPFLPCTTNKLDAITNTDKWIDKYNIRKPCEFYRSNLFFSDHFMLFILTLKEQYNTLTYLDIISCNISYHEQFNTLLNQGITVRHSTNLTGKNGDWILESHDINVTPFYFTNDVRLYNYTLDAPACINELVDLGTLPTGSNSFAYGCSADGSVIVGYSGSTNGDRAVQWVNGVISSLDTLHIGMSSQATGCSADGSVIVGYSTSIVDDTTAFRWTQADGLTPLGFLPGGISSRATGCSANGIVIVGYSTSLTGDDIAFRWTQAGGMTSLGFLPGGSISQASGCSADGSVIVGGSTDSTGGLRAFRWTTAGMISLGTLPGGLNSSATGCSADGSVIVGISEISGGGVRAFRWTTAGMISLGTLNDVGISYALGCSADGSTVVGVSDNASMSSIAFKWTQETGMVCLGTLGGNDSIAHGCSADGSVIVGSSKNAPAPNDYNRAFRYQSPFIPPAESSPILPTPITFVTPPVNPQTGDYDSSRLTNEKADKVIRVYTNTNQSNAMPVFPDYASYMRYINGALRF